MKTNYSLVLTLFAVVLFSCHSRAGENNTVELTLKAYAKYANEQNTAGMEAILHNEFRSISNQLFGSKSVSLTTKGEYLSMLEERKIGGGNREMTIISTKIEGKTATAQIIMNGKELSFKLFLMLVQLPDGSWQIISDMPHIL